MSESSKLPAAVADGIANQAANWVARRDRGLSAAEQDEYMQWLTADPRHAEALTQHAATFERMMQLYEWQPGRSRDSNPDLFAPACRSRRSFWKLSMAAAAVLALFAAMWWRPAEPSRPYVANSPHLRVNERRALSDGSVVELKDGSRIAIEYSDGVRGVRLVGEAHFKVAKDSARPFVVEAGGVRVRAVGTSFNVRLDSDSVRVLVTEGTVSVQSPPETANALVTRGISPIAQSPLVEAGHLAVVPLGPPTVARVSRATTVEIAEALDWQMPRLQFFETPLAIAVAEFNSRNLSQLVLGQPELGAVPIGGTFRVDNVDGFVRLLATTLDIQAKPRAGNEIVLTREP